MPKSSKGEVMPKTHYFTHKAQARDSLAAALDAAEVDAGTEHEQADDATNTAACLLARVTIVWSAVVWVTRKYY